MDLPSLSHLRLHRPSQAAAKWRALPGLLRQPGKRTSQSTWACLCCCRHGGSAAHHLHEMRGLGGHQPRQSDGTVPACHAPRGKASLPKVSSRIAPELLRRPAKGQSRNPLRVERSTRPAAARPGPRAQEDCANAGRARQGRQRAHACDHRKDAREVGLAWRHCSLRRQRAAAWLQARWWPGAAGASWQWRNLLCVIA